VVVLALIGIVGGLLAGVSPCILAVLPVVFFAGASGARSGRAADVRAHAPAGAGRPYLVALGLTVSFSLITLFGSLVLTALHLPQDLLRWAALVTLVLLGIAMMVPQFEELLQRPFARFPAGRPRDGSGFLLGLALGALYVPCAGPILATIIIAAATGNFGLRTIVATIAFALGTAVPLLFFALAGRRMAERVRAFRAHQRGIRLAGGAVVIVLAVAMTFHLTDALQRLVPDYTAAPANALDHNSAVNNALSQNGSNDASRAACQQYAGSAVLEDCGPEPTIDGITGWLNSSPLTLASLKGSVVLVDFWAYSCINCQRSIAHVQAWYQAYHASGFQVIGVHTPEYAFEKVPGNVRSGAARLGITYPVALDNNYATWNNFDNNSWPADYLIDASGNVRFVYIGEGDYPGMESLIRELLTAAHPGATLPGKTQLPDLTPTSQTQTPETYLGAQRANSFVDGQLEPGTATFHYPQSLQDDQFALTGTWDVSDESITARSDAGIALNFVADDIYLDVGGTGTVTATVLGQTTTYHVSGAPNIYTLLHSDTEHSGVLKVTLSPGLSAYSFTFG
jgi:cytochrome c biogenesis protein CcdA/thiol-disulfide isomerase/thioredoxin